MAPSRRKKVSKIHSIREDARQNGERIQVPRLVSSDRPGPFVEIVGSYTAMGCDLRLWVERVFFRKTV